MARFMAWIEQMDGPGSFTNLIGAKVEAYLGRELEPPTWQKFPFKDGDVVSEW
jgi:hypothetical protein